MDARVGKLEDEAVKRRERLKALRSRQHDTTDEDVKKTTADEHSVLPRSVGEVGAWV